MRVVVGFVAETAGVVLVMKIVLADLVRVFSVQADDAAGLAVAVLLFVLVEFATLATELMRWPDRYFDSEATRRFDSGEGVGR